MELNKNLKPIMLGRLNILPNGVYSLSGHLGDVQKINKIEYSLLKGMDGFHTIEELSHVHKLSLETVCEIYQKYRGDKKLTDLTQWNQVGWCEHCQVYVAGDICDLCGEKVEKIVFEPPCDPFIAFKEERNFILSILKNKFDIKLPDNAFFLVNNGIKDNVFFWEVVYKNKKLLKIIFNTEDASTWDYLMLCENVCEVTLPLELDSKMIDKIVKANKGRLDYLFHSAEVFIKECIQFFDSKPLIYFSGGKESLVMLSLFERLEIEANVITVLTGVEFPEDREFIYSYKSNIENNKLFQYFFFEEDGKNIIRNLTEKGVLSAKEPWCRVDFKKKLKNKGTQIIYNKSDFVACEGSRWYENDFRRRHPKVNFINDYEHQVWIHPLAEWTSFDIWIYMYQNKIPINPVYLKGFQRTTCWLCPIVNPYHIKCSKKYYPSLWKQISGCRMEAFGEDQSKDLPY